MIQKTHFTQNEIFPSSPCWELLLLPFSFSLRCSKNFQQLQYGLWASLVRLSVFWSMPARQQPLIQTIALGNIYSMWICVSHGRAISLVPSAVIYTQVYFLPPGWVNLVGGQAATPWSCAIKWSIIVPAPVSGFTFGSHFALDRHDQALWPSPTNSPAVSSRRKSSDRPRLSNHISQPTKL